MLLPSLHPTNSVAHWHKGICVCDLPRLRLRRPGDRGRRGRGEVQGADQGRQEDPRRGQPDAAGKGLWVDLV